MFDKAQKKDTPQAIVLEQLRILFEQTSEMIVITCSEGTIEYVNPTVEKLTGCPENKLLGQSFTILLNGNEKCENYKMMMETVRAGKIWSGKIIFKKNSGGIFNVELTKSPVLTENSKITHFIVMAKDISEKEMLEQELIKAKNLSSLGALASGIAHELNTPLGTILGFSEEIAKDGNLKGKDSVHMDWIVRETKRCIAVAQNLLIFSRGNETKKTNFDINEMISKILNLYNYQLKSDGIQICCSFSDDQMIIFGSPGQFQQVFINIFQNAYQSIKSVKIKGSLIIKTERIESKARVTIENNGPSIPEDYMEKIFDPFFTNKDVGSGAGLGLSITYGIIKDHGGRIWAENLSNGGVKFNITLPLTEVGERHEEKEYARLSKGLRILLVEDNYIYGDWLNRFLSGENAIITKTANGLEAIDKLKNQKADVIISDFKMDKMDGLELINWLEKNRPEYINKFILLTGYMDETFGELCRKKQVEYLLKPTDKRKLLNTIRKVSMGNL